jgi:hypothetical protein
MPYNLPPPWDPGFALPQNVRDEGDQRQAFVTKQMPNGTYYQSNVGTGGYAVPKYVMDEGYGQGTFTSKWLPNGTMTTPRVPHWQNKRPKVLSEQKLVGGGRAVTIRTTAPSQPGSPATNALSDITDPATLVPLAAAAAAIYLIFRKKR